MDEAGRLVGGGDEAADAAANVEGISGDGRSGSGGHLARHGGSGWGGWIVVGGLHHIEQGLRDGV